MTEETSPEAASVVEHRSLPDHWAAFVKALAIYPDSNSRVEACLRDLSDAIDETRAHVGGDGCFRVVFGRGVAAIGDQRFPAPPGSNLHWLRQRLDRAVLAGVVFVPPFDRDALVAFSKRLLVHFTRPELELPFHDLWPETYDGLELVPRRFDGVFEEFADDDTLDPAVGPAIDEEQFEPRMLEDDRILLNLLSSHDSVRDRLARIQDGLDGLAADIPGGSQDDADMNRVTRSMDLIGGIVQLLSAEDTQDFERVVQLTTGTLDTIADRLELSPSDRAQRAESKDELRRLLATVGQKLFGREAPSLLRTREDPQDLRLVRDDRSRSDAVITHDPQKFFEEFHELPASPDEKLPRHEMESWAEHLGTYLHYFVHVEDPHEVAGLHTGLRRLIDGMDPVAAKVLTQYINTAFEADSPDRAACARVATYLRQNHMTGAMRHCGMMGVESACSSFPSEFVAYLDALDFGDPGDMSELEDVCMQLGPEKIKAAADLLTREGGILKKGLAKRILEQQRRALMPLAWVILTGGGNTFRREVVRFLRRLSLEAGEAGPLMVIEKPGDLPDDYLTAILSPRDHGGYPSTLYSYAASILCQYIDEHQGKATAPRLHAIQRLADLSTPEARCLLEGLVTAASFPFLRKEPKRVRQLAREILKTID